MPVDWRAPCLVALLPTNVAVHGNLFVTLAFDRCAMPLAVICVAVMLDVLRHPFAVKRPVLVIVPATPASPYALESVRCAMFGGQDSCCKTSTIAA